MVGLPGPGPENRQTCSEDGDCPDGSFCDSSGLCETIGSTVPFGWSCDLPIVSPRGLVMRPDLCGGYFCMDGRCRSCRADRECQDAQNAEFSKDEVCRRTPAEPGNTCGLAGAAANAQPPITSSHSVLPYAEERVAVVKAYPHSTDAFTEGLIYVDGSLFESTGLVGKSSLRRVDLASGRVDRKVDIPPPLFAEGLAAVGGRLFQLSYDGGRALLWDRNTFTALGELTYTGQGWGLCYDGTHLVMSDGTDVLALRDPATFALVGRVPVRKRGIPVPRLNELECVGGEVYANIWRERHIARIDLATGNVKSWIDTARLIEESGSGADLSMAADLNGIAYLPESRHLLLTGKGWPAVFEVELKPLFAR
jgi:glutamine cyclotransferase